MRWGEQGGQAILSFRALVQSNRFERAWTLLAHTYKAEVTTLDNGRADTQLAMIGVSMRVTPIGMGVLSLKRIAMEVLSRVVDPLSDSGGAPLQVFFDSVDEFPSLHQASYESGCFNSSPPKAGHVE